MPIRKWKNYLKSLMTMIWNNVDKNYRNRAGILPPKKITAEEAEKYLKKDN